MLWQWAPVAWDVISSVGIVREIRKVLLDPGEFRELTQVAFKGNQTLTAMVNLICKR